MWQKDGIREDIVKALRKIDADFRVVFIWSDRTHQKYSFARLNDLARVEPVTVAKHGRPVEVVMAVEEYERRKAFGGPRNTASENGGPANDC